MEYHHFSDRFALVCGRSSPFFPGKSVRARTLLLDCPHCPRAVAQAAVLSRGASPPPLALHEAVVAAQPMRTHGARTRQLLYIGKVMRQLESSVLSRVRAALEPGRAVASRP
jgi:hypothetical protein